MVVSDYLSIAFLERDRIVDKAVCNLKSLKFDTIAFSRYSGALIAPIVAYKLKKKILFVRNKLDTCHSDLTVEGQIDGKKYIIIDDCFEYGTTISTIINEVDRFEPDLGLFGVYLYDHPALKTIKGFTNPVTGEPVYFVGGRNHLTMVA